MGGWLAWRSVAVQKARRVRRYPPAAVHHVASSQPPHAPQGSSWPTRLLPLQRTGLHPPPPARTCTPKCMRAFCRFMSRHAMRAPFTLLGMPCKREGSRQASTSSWSANCGQSGVVISRQPTCCCMHCSHAHDCMACAASSHTDMQLPTPRTCAARPMLSAYPSSRRDSLALLPCALRMLMALTGYRTLHIGGQGWERVSRQGGHQHCAAEQAAVSVAAAHWPAATSAAQASSR